MSCKFKKYSIQISVDAEVYFHIFAQKELRRILGVQKFISRIFLKIIGWNIYGSLPEGLTKAVLIAAPHTSNWDFVIGRAGFYKLGLKKVKFLIKKEMFKFPLGPVIKSWGAIPTDRGKNNNTIAQVSKMFAEEKKLLLLITPEGTRSYVEHWKKGFYHI